MPSAILCAIIHYNITSLILAWRTILKNLEVSVHHQKPPNSLKTKWDSLKEQFHETSNVPGFNWARKTARPLFWALFWHFWFLAWPVQETQWHSTMLSLHLTVLSQPSKAACNVFEMSKLLTPRHHVWMASWFFWYSSLTFTLCKGIDKFKPLELFVCLFLQSKSLTTGDLLVMLIWIQAITCYNTVICPK